MSHSKVCVYGTRSIDLLFFFSTNFFFVVAVAAVVFDGFYFIRRRKIPSRLWNRTHARLHNQIQILISLNRTYRTYKYIFLFITGLFSIYFNSTKKNSFSSFYFSLPRNFEIKTRNPLWICLEFIRSIFFVDISCDFKALLNEKIRKKINAKNCGNSSNKISIYKFKKKKGKQFTIKRTAQINKNY